MNCRKLTKATDRFSKPSKIASFDIETTEWINPYALGFYDGKNMIVFEGDDCIDRFIDFVIQKRYRNWLIYAHNGGKFDFNFILESIVKNKKGLIIKPLRIGSRIVEIKLQDKNRNTWILRDSMGYFSQLGKNSSLAALTKNFDVEDVKGELEHDKINSKNWKQMRDEWLPYLISDCKGLRQLMVKFEMWIIERFKVNLRKNITIAQLAMAIFRTRFLKNSIINHRAIEDDVRKSYYGGRTEIFQHYIEDANYYDFNSLYPFVMKEYPIPIGVPVKSYNFKLGDFGIAFIDVEVPKDLKIPVLPFRAKNKKLIFPVGRFSGWYCSPEIELAVKMGCKIKINYGYKFEKDKIFDEYIDTFYKIKQEAKKDSIDYLLSKLFMNSLYGKFGQRREKRAIIMNPKTIIGKKMINDFMYEEERISESGHILPAIASFITCYARCELYNVLKDSEPIYCDTDSVITKKKLESDSHKLGALKDEMPQGIKEGVFILPKMYGLVDNEGKEYVKCKGFPKKMFNYSILKQAMFSKDFSNIKFEREKFGLAFESLKRSKSFVSMITQKRSIKSKYDKRIEVDLYNTLPIEIKL